MSIKTKIQRWKRYTPLAHYILKINSFTQLSDILRETGDGKYESDEFEVADKKWKLVLYPNGNLKANGEGHISLYLASTDQSAISSGCHVDVLVSFFVYDHIRDKYLTIKDGKSKRYNNLRTEHGFDQLLPLLEFNDSKNGYVVGNCCEFGVEVHVIKNTLHANELSLIKDPPNGTLTWKIDNFSTLENMHHSEAFSAGGIEWKLRLYPKGENEKDRSLSLYLELDAKPCKSRVYAEYNLLVKDQLNGTHHKKQKVSYWFGNGNYPAWGFPSFMLLKDLRDASKGFLILKVSGNRNYESDEFEAANYKWEGHISLYLASTNIEAISRSTGGHINVFFNFFVYDHIRDKYLAIEDGKIKRYHALRTENGFDKLLPLAEFNDPSNGYLVDDCCVFGVEVNLFRNTVKGNELSFAKDPPNGTFTWKIQNFSRLENPLYYSEVFNAGGCKCKVYAEFTLLLKDQLNGMHRERKASHWFQNTTSFGYGSFVRLEDLHNASKGFLVDDSLVVEAKLTLISYSQDLIS
ncbi:TRAF-like family protein [Euphorbia peplus]|nr:TRAF-like family protein [Euphorbia peplus]